MPKPSPPPLECFAPHSEDSNPSVPYSLSPICHGLSDISTASQGNRMEELHKSPVFLSWNKFLCLKILRRTNSVLNHKSRADSHRCQAQEGIRALYQMSGWKAAARSPSATPSLIDDKNWGAGRLVSLNWHSQDDNWWLLIHNLNTLNSSTLFLLYEVLVGGFYRKMEEKKRLEEKDFRLLEWQI